MKELNEYSTQLIKETIIPKLTYQVNTSKRYAPLRQVYYSLILAQWFKQKYSRVTSDQQTVTRENPYIKMIDSGNLTSNLQLLTSQSPYSKDDYFQQYQKSFQDGEYNLQEQVYTPMGQSIRRYVSGGMFLGGIAEVSSPVNIRADKPMPKAQYLLHAMIDNGEISSASSAITNDFVSLPVEMFSLKKLSFYNALVASLGKIDDSHYYYGLVKDDKIIGFLHYTTGGFINEVVVLPGAQRGGVGLRMLKAATYDLVRIGNKKVLFNIASYFDLRDDDQAGVLQKTPAEFYYSFSHKEGYTFKSGSASLGGLDFDSPSELLFPDKMVRLAAAKAFSSAVEDKNSSVDSAGSFDNNPGGIAFNSLPIQIESIVSPALGALPEATAFKGDLDEEWGKIQAVFNAGIRPSIQRISEYTAAASASPLAEDKIDQVRVMLADILRRDEESERLAPAEESCKQILRALESG